MKKRSCLFLTLALAFPFVHSTVHAQKLAVYSYPVEIELTNDQGDMPTKDYLKHYGTKGKKRSVEYIYEAVTPFLMSQFEKAGYPLLPIDTLSGVKANEYGHPATSLAKAVATGISNRYVRIQLKDITSPPINGLTPQDPGAQQKKLVKMRCKIQIYGADKQLVTDVEGTFQSGERIDNPTELGVDLRKYQGSDYLQEVKIYESCTKMAILRAIRFLTNN